MATASSVKRKCNRFLSYRYPKSARQELSDLADSVTADIEPDDTGGGPLLENLEKRIAELLGKPAAVFMPSGKTAQLIALRVWCDRHAIRTFATHPRSHIEVAEAHAHQFLYDLKAIPLGHANRQTNLLDIQTIAEPVGAVSIELPLRNLGWPLPEWHELQAMSNALRARKIPFHADAARIWELQPYYDCGLSEIAALFDSLYVSFYKGLGGPAGAALAGPETLIAEAKLWQHRAGARLNKLYPYIIGAQRGLDQFLPLMSRYYAKACAVAAALNGLPGIRTNPVQPKCNSFQIVLDGDETKLPAARIATAEATGIWPFERIVPSPVEGFAIIEAVILDAALELTEAEIASCIATLSKRLNTSD